MTALTRFAGSSALRVAAYLCHNTEQFQPTRRPPPFSVCVTDRVEKTIMVVQVALQRLVDV